MIRSDKSYADQLVDLKVFEKIHISKKDEMENPLNGYHMTKPFIRHIDIMMDRLSSDKMGYETLRVGEAIISILVNYFNEMRMPLPSPDELEAMGIVLLEVWIHQFHMEDATYTDAFGNVRLRDDI